MIDIPLMMIVSKFLAIGIRLTGMMLFAPFFGSVVIPARVKAMLVLALSFVVYPTVERGIDPDIMNHWPLLVFTEFIIGVGMGVATNIVFEAALLAGQVVGVQMGYSLVNILDPQTQVETTVIPMFYQSILMLLFLQMDVHLWILRAVDNSYRYLPPGTAHLTNLFTLATCKTVGEVFALGVQVAAPVLAATLAADIILGLLGKASPQMPLMLLGPAVKSLLGIVVLIATLKYWPDLFRSMFTAAITNSEQLLHLAS